jgi:hypothetical protein
LAGPSAVVAPAPQVDQATARRLALPQASAVAPAPEIGTSSERAVRAPDANASRVVPPPPSVQNAANPTRTGRLNSLSGAGPNVVPPPPSVQGAGKATGDGRLASMATPASQVVPPSPSMQNGGIPVRPGRLSTLSNAGPNVVPPPPSVQGKGGDGRLASIPGAGSRVVPPPPSVQGSNGSAGGSRVGSLSGLGPEVVPPPPSVEGAGNSAGRLGTLAANTPGEGSQISPPPPSAGAGNVGASGSAKSLDPMDPLTDGDASSTTASNQNQPSIAELPLGLLGVVFAPQGSSYFSNFEVFVAKRKVGKDQFQLIKLVYEFLPYQRRLSEYDLNNLPPRIIKLRVTPDPNCDESLGQMILTHNDSATPAEAYAKLPAALRQSDLTAVLPCYRTSASDFQRAMSGTN